MSTRQKKTKAALIFISGWSCGVLTIVLIAIFTCYGIHQKGGSPLVEPKLYGNIKVYACKNEDQVAHDIGLENWVIIEKNKDVLLSLSFNNDKEFSGFSFHNKGDMIISYAVPLQGEKFAFVDYGALEQNMNWMDYNSDGIFDLQVNKEGNIKKILIEDHWVKVKAGSKRAIVEIDGTEIEYDFNRDLGKWLPVSDNNNESPPAAE